MAGYGCAMCRETSAPLQELETLMWMKSLAITMLGPCLTQLLPFARCLQMPTVAVVEGMNWLTMK